MTITQFKEMLLYNEPSFSYHGKEYGICHPNDLFGVYAEDQPSDIELSFQNVDDLLDGWMIQGKPFREILPEIDLVLVTY